jgi:hypothetical protein
MPSGYTAEIYDGKDVTFEEFVLTCARAFGALIEMRDEPFGTTIPNEFEPSPYYVNLMQKAQGEVKNLQEMDEHEKEAHAKVEYEKDLERWQTEKSKREALAVRYHAMLRRVNNWIPPTIEHKELRNFMRDQLEESIKFDCGWTQKEPRRHTGKEWYEEKLNHELYNVSYYAENYKKELERTSARNEWVRALRESLG